MSHLVRKSLRKILPARAAAGFTLIELMVAMVLGLIVIAGATSVFLASQRTYRTNQALSDVQENARIAFELMARDIRDAGLTGCNNNGRVANVLKNSPTGGGTAWWANWGNALVGFDSGQSDPAIGTSMPSRSSGTDSLELLGADDSGLSVASHDPTSAQFKLNETSSDLQPGDVVVVCDPDHAAIVQVTNYNSSNVTLVHNTGEGTPGNCSKGLGYPTVCTTNGNAYAYGPNSQIAKLSAVDWYIGDNSAGGHSLYRVNVATSAGAPTPTAQEMVRDVTDMEIVYHQSSDIKFVTATDIAGNWASVDAVRVTLTMESVDKRAGTDVKPITREFTATTTVRNRVQ